MHADNAIIDALGGPAKLAELLKFPKGGRQRVCNWRKRGIPARVKLSRPDLFLRPVKPRTKKTQSTKQSDAAQA
jgi:hypothetical protein